MYIPSMPLHMVLILGTRCNLRCLHCSSGAGEPVSNELSPAEIQRVIRELADAGVVDIALSGGEPLLRKDLEDYVELARSLGMTVGTSTNGYALTCVRARSLRQAGLSRLQVSLDGTRESHEHVRGTGAWSAAIKAIENAVTAGLQTNVCFTAMSCNYHCLTEVIDTVVELGVSGFNLSQFVATGRGQEAEALNPEQGKTVLETWLIAKKQYPEVQFTAHLSGLAALEPSCADLPGFIGCQAGIYIGCITATGDVTPCVMLPVTVGNIRSNSFQEIWARSSEIQQLQGRALPGVCGHCPHTRTCGGCRAAAYARTGDFMQDDDSCWVLAGLGEASRGGTRATPRCL